VFNRSRHEIKQSRTVNHRTGEDQLLPGQLQPLIPGFPAKKKYILLIFKIYETFNGLLVVGLSQIRTQRVVRMYNAFGNPGGTAGISEPCRSTQVKLNFFYNFSCKILTQREMTRFRFFYGVNQVTLFNFSAF
jgi:hypothetical protein